MTKVIQIRGVSDDLHAKLVAAAERAGMSLTAYLSSELEVVARRADLVRHNSDVLARLRSDVGRIDVAADEVLHVIHAGRDGRTQDLTDRVTRQGDA